MMYAEVRGTSEGISHVQPKAFMAVTEWVTEAAAATEDEKTQAVLFLGRVVKP